MEKIIKKIKEIKSNENYSAKKVFLIKSLSNKTGFFIHEEKVLFAELSSEMHNSKKIETTYLTLITKVFVESLSDNQSFKNGEYNIIYFNQDYEDENFEYFIRLCSLYSEQSNLIFVDFFNSLINIFQLTKDKRNINAIGLFGELSLIKYYYEEHSLDISHGWHIEGLTSKYDFAFNNINLEVKTTVTEKNSFQLKHTQVFNETYVYIILIKISKGSISIKKMYDYFLKEKPFSNNFTFQIRLHDAISNIEKIKLENAYKLENIYIYNSKDLETIKIIPDEINNINYDYTFDFNLSKRTEELKKIIDLD